jgi:orotidine-5'-phosphate decarboxylase
MKGFSERLRTIQEARQSVLCIGLDPDPLRLPAPLVQERDRYEAIDRFLRSIIDATAPKACAFKLNVAFFEVMGEAGWRLLSETIRYIPDDVLVIADGKRGDIGNSARFYAESVFEHLSCDACTVVPYMGKDAVLPFLAYPDRAAFVLARTSNPDAGTIQDVRVDGAPLYERVAALIREWDESSPGTAGLVVGATAPEALTALRAACPTQPFLIPGVGAQGGDPIAVMRASWTTEGTVLVSSSRQILYASDQEDFAEAAAAAAADLSTALWNARPTV